MLFRTQYKAGVFKPPPAGHIVPVRGFYLAHLTLAFTLTGTRNSAVVTELQRQLGVQEEAWWFF